MISSKLKKYYVALVLGSLTLIPGSLLAAEDNAPALIEHENSFGEVVRQSVYGDVYSDPSQWQELSLGNFFTKGWG